MNLLESMIFCLLEPSVIHNYEQNVVRHSKFNLKKKKNWTVTITSKDKKN